MTKEEKESFVVQFGEYVRIKREKLGLKQSDLAASMDVDQQSISRMERGKVDPSLSWCNRLADALKIPLNELMQDFKPKK